MRWLRRNLFNSWLNTLLTIVSVWLIYVLVSGLLRWALTEARWGVITQNLRLFMVGRYPIDQVWRVSVSVLIISFLLGLSWGAWGGVVRSFAVALAAGCAALALVPFSLSARLWLAGNVVLIVGAFLVVHFLPSRHWKRGVLIAWLLSPVAIYILLYGRIVSLQPLPVVETNLWGGLLLTFVLTIVGIVVSMPIGILLALGRRSELPAVRWFSVAFIEVVRGVPLITLLFFAASMLPIFLPQNFRIDLIWRIMLIIILFSAAYNAENVRGGLQAVPPGQAEAAKALGMKGWMITTFIVMPQALRVVIPATVSQFISLFKDTSLVGIAGLLELLFIGKTVLAQPSWLGLQQEVYVFVAIIYFIFSYAMSYASLRLEAALGVGQR
ncbi:MAG: amino acid ABC transporter permease [Anaerolineae bacterium]|nr:amino acid ABC transporter permease [Anaerolineae bacterium]